MIAKDITAIRANLSFYRTEPPKIYWLQKHGIGDSKRASDVAAHALAIFRRRLRPECLIDV
jgi:hypothetical protein